MAIEAAPTTVQTIFNRYEKKYLMTKPVYEELRRRLEPYMQVDQYGLTTICNIYYDTANHELIRRSIEQPVYKEKLRLRSYGVPGMNSLTFLEIKKKYEGLVNKRRVPIILQQAYDYVERGIRPPQEHTAAEEQIFREIDFFLERYPLQRGLTLCYERVALFETANPEFRVTFDSNIRGRRTDMGLENGAFGNKLLPDDYYLMETKILDATPLWFTKIISDLNLYLTPFSKYGNIYKKERDAYDGDSLMRHRKENWKEIEELEYV